MTGIETRKADHIRINLDEDVGFDRLTVGFENYRFIHQALPELDLHAVDLTTRLFNKSLKAPVLISSMTGGTEQARQINLNLAAAAQQYGVAMGLGSQRAGIVRPETADTFKVRQVAPREGQEPEGLRGGGGLLLEGPLLLHGPG